MSGESKKGCGVVVGALDELKMAVEMALGFSVGRKRAAESSWGLRWAEKGLRRCGWDVR